MCSVTFSFLISIPTETNSRLYSNDAKGSLVTVSGRNCIIWCDLYIHSLGHGDL